MRNLKVYTAKRIIQKDFDTLLSICVGALMGSAFFALVMGVEILNPTDISWVMTQQDPKAHFLGWHFFRNEPWTFPPGLIKNYIAPTGTTIGNTDSIPIMAFIFKPFNGLLTVDFQYFGLWIALCYALQGVFGVLLMKLITPNMVLQLLGTMFLIMSPLMLWRYDGGHISLMGHWLLLSAIWLILRSDKRILTMQWLALIGLSALIHPYLHAMVFLLWLAYFLQSLIAMKLRLSSSLTFGALVLGVTIFCFWLTGFFNVAGREYAVGGYGDYSMNITAAINPQGWSSLLEDRPADPSTFGEGFNYLGAGLLFLCIAAIPICLWKRSSLRLWTQHLPLIAICMALTIFSLGGTIYFDDNKILQCDIGPLRFLSSVYRASGRFFWPVWYLICIIAISAPVSKLKSKYATIILIIAVLLQGYDFHDKFISINNKHEARSWLPLQSNFLDDAAKRYKKIHFIPQRILGPDYQNLNYEYFAYLAASNRLSINTGSSARLNLTAYRRDAERLLDNIIRGEYENDTMYIVTEWPLLQTIKAKMKKADALKYAGGKYVLLPRWNPSENTVKPLFLLTAVPLENIMAGKPTKFTIAALNADRITYPPGYKLNLCYQWFFLSGQIHSSGAFMLTFSSSLKPGEQASFDVVIPVPEIGGKYSLIFAVEDGDITSKERGLNWYEMK